MNVRAAVGLLWLLMLLPLVMAVTLTMTSLISRTEPLIKKSDTCLINPPKRLCRLYTGRLFICLSGCLSVGNLT